MLQVVRNQLLKIIDEIDAGNSNATDEELVKTAKFLSKTLRKDLPLSKYQAYTFLGMSRASFDNKVRSGELPRGQKIPGHNELQWFKKDLIPHKKK